MFKKTLLKFAESQQIVGHITVASGSLLLTDGVWDSPEISEENKQLVDLGPEYESVKIPVSTVIQNNKRYIILSVDDASKA
jgi:hypothetical protein